MSSPGHFFRYSSLVALTAFYAHAQAGEPAPSAASEAPEQVELSYVGQTGCPTKTAFASEVAARIRRPIEWVTENGTTRIVVTVTELEGHATGRLEVVRRAAEPTRREFAASSCAEVSSALALVTALTLDPNARTERLPAPLASDETPRSNAAESPPTAPSSPPPPPPEKPPAEPIRALAPPPPPPSERQARPTAGYVVWLGPTAGVAGGYAPEPLVTLGASLGARAAARRGFSPSFQLTPLWGKTGSTGPAASGGTFAWAMARLEACPTELRVLAPLTLEACVAGEIGRLSARGAEGQIAEPVTADRWWAAAGVTLALHFSLGRWFTRLGAHGLFPFTRDEFVFRDPDQTVHQAGGFTYGSSLSLGFEFGQ
jgi:hypothetical protein